MHILNKNIQINIGNNIIKHLSIDNLEPPNAILVKETLFNAEFSTAFFI